MTYNGNYPLLELQEFSWNLQNNFLNQNFATDFFKIFPKFELMEDFGNKKLAALQTLHRSGLLYAINEKLIRSIFIHELKILQKHLAIKLIL